MSTSSLALQTSPYSTRSARRAKRRRSSAIATATVLAATMVAAGSPSAASDGQVVEDLTTKTAQDLATALVGPGVTISSVVYDGSPQAAGLFSGMAPVGFETGIVLSSGRVADVVGPNSEGAMTTDFSLPGDARLDSLAGQAGATRDASVFGVTFVPTKNTVSFRYVFSSEEYNEYANTTFNDVFGFFVNGENCALTPDGQPVSVNTINGGNPFGTDAKHPELFRNNDYDAVNGSPFDLQPDGLTVALTCQARVTPGVNNEMVLAIADVSDGSWNSTVLLESGSFESTQNAPTALDDTVTTQQDTPVEVTLEANDLDGDPLTYSVVTDPTHGTLTGSGDTRTYTPASGYLGPDSFTFRANDGLANSNTATVSINVTQAVSTPTLSLATMKDYGTITAYSRLTPAHPGLAIKMTMWRKKADGSWRRLSVKSPLQNSQGTAVAAFSRPAPGTCRVAAKFAGDADHSTVTTKKIFSC